MRFFVASEAAGIRNRSSASVAVKRWRRRLATCCSESTRRRPERQVVRTAATEVGAAGGRGAMAGSTWSTMTSSGIDAEVAVPMAEVEEGGGEKGET